MGLVTGEEDTTNPRQRTHESQRADLKEPVQPRKRPVENGAERLSINVLVDVKRVGGPQTALQRSIDPSARTSIAYVAKTKKKVHPTSCSTPPPPRPTRDA